MTSKKYVEIVFPLPLDKAFTYKVPETLEDSVFIGVRAVAPFGKRIMTGYIINILDRPLNEAKDIKYIEDILDAKPVFPPKLIEFCRWTADYYMSSLGEVLKTAVPYGSDVESRKSVVVDTDNIQAEYNRQVKKDTNYYKLLSLLLSKPEHSFKELTKKFTGTNLNYNLQKLEKNGLCTIFVETLKPKVSVKTENVYKLSEKALNGIDVLINSLEKKAPKQVNVLITLLGCKEEFVSQNELLEKAKVNQPVLSQLLKKGLILKEQKEVKREYNEAYQEEQKEIVLNGEQRRVHDVIAQSIVENKFRTFLIHGVTASGKTQVYLELIKKAVEKGRSALYLVPEISLTPQVIRRVKNFFGNNVAVLHSRMSLGEKYDQWRSVINKESNIVIGPRSALFAPLENIGIIIIDEEHDYSYKQNDTAPFYNARDAAIIRGHKENAVVILGSATPSLESYYNALANKYTLLELKNRADSASLPDINFVNLKEEKEAEGLVGIYSKKLIEKITEKNNNNEKVILLQNRRGYATYISCPDCGFIETCKNCTVSLTYHLANKEYVCHYCNYSKKETDYCPQCGSMGIKFKGTGTQKVEDEIEILIPDIKVARMDYDTTSKKGAYSQILSDFSSGKFNLLLGTQMVAKGLDFPDVTLVGVISAEASLHFPDFRAAERTYQLLSQVAGRSGRSKLKGEVLIQTYNPNHYALECVKEQNYKRFFNQELDIRKNADYPPFVKLALIEFSGNRANSVKNFSKVFFNLLRYDTNVIKVLGPAPANIFKLNKKYRYNIILKSKRQLDPNGSYLHKVIREARESFLKNNKTSNIRISIDIDPMNLI